MHDFKVGLDIGSTTIKMVVLNEHNELIYKAYERHLSEIEQAFAAYLAKLKDIVAKNNFALTVTGSAGMGLADRFNLAFVQEVIACAMAVKKLIPKTDISIEIGGEDAKITYFGPSTEQRMNGACAGGTGSFIDQMATLLSTDADGLNNLARNGKQLYTIASRCGVFAKTDIQALMNDGAKKEDLALSIFQAVVNQTISNLAQGRPFLGKIAFLGGPLTFLPELKQRFVQTLKLTEDQMVDVQDGCYFVALGAALCEEHTEVCIKELERALNTSLKLKNTSPSTQLHLFEDTKDYQQFIARHSKATVKKRSLTDFQGRVFLGIDAGSTTTKLALISENHELLYSSYGSNQGAPLNTVVRELKNMYLAMPDACKLSGVMVTGYGEGLIHAALHTDFSEVETVAHLRAAQEFCPEVSFVMDIGGQDMKCFMVSQGNIGSITLNEACSAGCGSFIETFARSLGLTTQEFAELAVSSKHPVDLGTRCTVFMNSKVKQAQKDGASVADLSAGIAISVIKNALFKVMQLKDPKALGAAIVVQGGTFLNNAVLKALEKILNLEVLRPDISGLMGAYGAAILASEQAAKTQHTSTLLSAEKLDDFKYTSKSYRCKRCGNNCLITMQIFSDGGHFYTGNRCEKGIGSRHKTVQANNLYQFKINRLFNYYTPLAEAPRGKIGIPRGLNLYEDYPFWFTLFTQLGYEVVLSSVTTPDTYQKGLATIPSESLCYPAKLMHGHIMDLVEQGIKKIFYPCLPYNMEDEVHRTENHFNCPVVGSYAENIRCNMDILANQHVIFYQPFLPINSPKRLKQRLAEELKAEHLGRRELSRAVDFAYAELSKYREEVRQEGLKVLIAAQQAHEPVVILAGRPYHIDPEINHGIAGLIASYNLPVISEDAVYHENVNKEPRDMVNQWSYHARLYHAAQYAAEHDKVILIQLSSFGCGLDAITTEQVKTILERHQKIYTLIKLDEVNNLGAVKIRLRSLLASLKRHQSTPFTPIPFIDRPRFKSEDQFSHTILAPQMSPVHFELISHVMQKHHYQVIIPDLPNKDAIEYGLRYVNNDMCYPAIVVVGQLLYALKSGKYDPDRTSIMLFQTCGACRATNYMAVLRRSLKFAGFPQVAVFACSGLETDAFRMNRNFFKDAIKACLYGDLLMSVKNRMKPYELKPGSVDELYNTWMQRCKQELDLNNQHFFLQNIKQIVRDFDAIPINEQMHKPKVGIVGEILVKYHPIANNKLEDLLVKEGAEVVMPELTDFFLYLGYDRINNHDLLDGKLTDKLKSLAFIKYLEHFRQPIARALKKSRHFGSPQQIKKTALQARRFVSLGNMAGEGWFLTGEMVKLIENKVPNIVCLQPFGCLPNHITGKGVLHALRKVYQESNIVTIDCDAGSSEVNQLNRVKLMLSVAKDNLSKQDTVIRTEHVIQKVSPGLVFLHQFFLNASLILVAMLPLLNKLGWL